MSEHRRGRTGTEQAGRVLDLRDEADEARADVHDDEPTGAEAGRSDQREGDPRGRSAAAPEEIPPRGWLDIAKRTAAESKKDHISLLAAGVAFYALLALFPGIIALISIWGLVAEPATVERQITSVTDTLPEEAATLVTDQMRSVSESTSGGLGLGAAIGIATALWAASAGMKHLMAAIGAAYDEPERRGFVKLRGTAILLTLGAIAFVGAAVAVIAVIPMLLDDTAVGGVGRLLGRYLPYVALALGFLVGLSVLYRVGPDRDDARWRWVSWGAAIATVLWILASLVFSFYVTNFGSYNQTYGSVGAVVVLMLWLAITSFVILLGAEVNAETEAQTAQDSTVGPEDPLGERGAQKADELGHVPA